MGPKQLDLFDDLLENRAEPNLYHDIGTYGYFSILAKEDKTLRQNSYTLSLMPTVIELLPKDRDTWLSQAEFIKPNRRVVNLLRVGLAFVDLDTYRTPYRAYPPETIAKALWYFCDDNNIPQPSVILFSGRGLQAKWLFEKAIPRQALPRWNTVQRALVDVLQGFGADKKAKDASRVLRLVKTVNTISGKIVRVLHVTESNGQPIRYDFDRFADEVLPYTREETAQYKKKKAAKLKTIKGRKPKNLRPFSGRQLAWHRLEDLRTLARLRGWLQFGVPEGNRDCYLFWTLNFLLLSGATNSIQMHYEADALAREVCPGFTNDHDLRSLLSTLYRKAKEFEAGETIEFNGKQYPPLYTPKNSTLMEFFEITSEEEKRLRTIISQEEAIERRRERDKERKRAVEGQTREEYLAQAEAKRQEAIRLYEHGMSIREIAVEMDVSKSQIHRYIEGCPMSSPITMA